MSVEKYLRAPADVRNVGEIIFALELAIEALKEVASPTSETLRSLEVVRGLLGGYNGWMDDQIDDLSWARILFPNQDAACMFNGRRLSLRQLARRHRISEDEMLEMVSDLIAKRLRDAGDDPAALRRRLAIAIANDDRELGQKILTKVNAVLRREP